MKIGVGVGMDWKKMGSVIKRKIKTKILLKISSINVARTFLHCGKKNNLNSYLFREHTRYKLALTIQYKDKSTT